MVMSPMAPKANSFDDGGALNVDANKTVPLFRHHHHLLVVLHIDVFILAVNYLTFHFLPKQHNNCFKKSESEIYLQKIADILGYL